MNASDPNFGTVFTRGYLKNKILVQGDAKLMPLVVQGGGEVPPG